MTSTLFHVHDPMCSWCWAFKPTWERIRAGLGNRDIVHTNVLGGLAPDSSQPMAESMRQMLQQTWKQIQMSVPDTQFNFDFWENCAPRRSTYPSCRAVLSAKAQNTALEEPMIAAIQRAYYLQARNPSDNDVLIELADEIGCDTDQFALQLDSEAIGQALQQDLELTRTLGVQGFPSLVLKIDQQIFPIPVQYDSAISVLDHISQIENSISISATN